MSGDAGDLLGLDASAASLRVPRLHPVELVVQRLQADAEHLGGAGLVAAGVLERHLDQLAFGLVDGRAGREAGTGRGCRRRRRRSAGQRRQIRRLDQSGPSATIVARSMTLRSSRTLPGQS